MTKTIFIHDPPSQGVPEGMFQAVVASHTKWLTLVHICHHTSHNLTVHSTFWYGWRAEDQSYTVILHLSILIKTVEL